jgi:prepilin-type N-terminal cleavage/methylation domain-containing protein
MPILSVGNRRGITLLELVIVLAIIALIAGVSFPAITAGLEGVRLTTATDSIATFLNAATNRAERRQQVVEVVISRKENALRMYTNEPGFERKLQLPDGVFIQAIFPASNDEPEAPRQFVLMPGGTVPRIGVQIGGRGSNARIVRLDPMTGFPRVERVVRR